MITSNAKILCVDDEPDLLNITEDILRSAGYEVIRATTGHECLAAARKEHSDLILLDVGLPDIDGFDVCKQIKSDPEFFGIYIIMISGTQTSSETQAKGLDAGADGYIARPVSGMELLARIQAMLRIKQAETALRKSEERLHFLLSATPAVIYTCKASPPYGATFVSKNVKTQMGYKPEEFTEDPNFWAEHIHPEDALRVISNIPHLFENDHYIHEYRFLHKDGNYRWMHDNLNLIRDVDGKPIKIAGFWLDITDRKKTEELLSEALLIAEAASRAKSKFLANMSHELTTPLNSIIGFSQILQDRLYGDLNEKQTEYVSDILKSGVNLLGLLNDILDMSKLDTSTRELKKIRFLLKDLLNTMTILFKAKSMEKNILLRFEIAPEAEIEIEADLGVIKQIMFNLLDNALKYTPDRGSVQVNARKVPSSEIPRLSLRGVAEAISKDEIPRSARNDSFNDYIEISVTDTGIGIK
ncbi:MAG: PAS domain-containing protein, partial [Thermodesulfovibrionales bacterium]|nr:PAS domain-containing protein [Thermodesulfovibrionales bacterium]